MKNNNGKKRLGELRLYLSWPMILIFYFIIADIFVYMVNEKAGGIFFLFLVVYAIFAIYLHAFRFNSLPSALARAIENQAKIQGIDFDEVDIPHAVLSKEGRVLWGNKKFTGLINSSIVGLNIKEIFKEVSAGTLLKLTEEKEIILSEYNNRKYRIELRSLSLEKAEELNLTHIFNEDDRLVLLYLYDETDYYNLKTEYDNNKQVIGFIYIDNYYEVAENMEDSKAAMLIAMVDRKLTRYVSYNKGIIKKLEKDKYFFITTKKDINDMIEDGFSILTQTKEIIGGDNIPLTLSIGIGYEGKSLEANHDLARVAIDMALGRGGDQVVVKRGKDILYFGGKSASTTTTVKVRARVKAMTFRETLDTKDKVLVVGHKNGDFDSFGASIGVYIMAKQLSKECHIVINSLTKAVGEVKNRMENSDRYPKDMFIDGDEALKFADENTLLVIVDHNVPNIADEQRIFDLGLDKVVFDHHRMSENTINDTVISYIEPSASSTCELVVEVMNYFEETLKVKQLEADSMFAGIVVDTMYFTYHTSARTFDAASYLKSKGADNDRVRKLLRVDLDYEKAKIEIINNAEFYKGCYAIAIIDENYNIESGVAKALIADELIDIKGMKASFVISYDGDTYNISSRAIDDVNVQVLMEEIGGGGHRSQAGASIRAENFEEVVNKIKELIDKYEKENKE